MVRFSCKVRRATSQVATDALVAAGFRFGKVPVVEKVIPLKPKLFGNTHFWLET